MHTAMLHENCIVICVMLSLFLFSARLMHPYVEHPDEQIYPRYFRKPTGSYFVCKCSFLFRKQLKLRGLESYFLNYDHLSRQGLSCPLFALYLCLCPCLRLDRKKAASVPAALSGTLPAGPVSSSFAEGLSAQHVCLVRHRLSLASALLCSLLLTALPLRGIGNRKASSYQFLKF